MMRPTPPHLKTLEEIERECIPGLVEVLRWEGIEGVRYALFDMTNWHADYDPCIWRSRASEEQKLIGWQMWVRMEKIIAEVDRKRGGFQDMAAEGLITFDELRVKLAELEDTREAAERELEALRGCQEEIEELERDRDALVAFWFDALPEDLDRLTSEQRNDLYCILHLEVTPRVEGYEVKGPFCTVEPLSFSRSPTTARTPPPPHSSSAAFRPR